MAVWEQAGDILGVGSNDDGLPGANIPLGSGNDVPLYSVGTPGSADATQGAAVNAPVGIVLNQENNIQTTDKMSAEEVAQILNDRIRGMVDNISNEMAEQLVRIFANMPVKGGA